MSSISWVSGYVDFGRIEGQTVVRFFENGGVVWYDDQKGIARPGWQAELEPYCGPDYVGAPFRRGADSPDTPPSRD